jgi:hypothetical protein
VDEGRERLNFSNWPPRRLEREEFSEVVYEGGMPPSYYIVLHPDAQMSDAEKQQLVQGLQQIAGR